MMKPSKPTQTGTPSPVPTNVPLSPHWGFVVQFRALPGGPAYKAGRVEHLVSGRTSHFQSLEELHAYLDRELQASKGV